MCAITTKALSGTVVNARFYFYRVMTFKVGNASRRNIALDLIILNYQTGNSGNNGRDPFKCIHYIKAIFIFAFEQFADKSCDTAQFLTGNRFCFIVHSFYSSQ